MKMGCEGGQPFPPNFRGGTPVEGGLLILGGATANFPTLKIKNTNFDKIPKDISTILIKSPLKVGLRSA